MLDGVVVIDTSPVRPERVLPVEVFPLPTVGKNGIEEMLCGVVKKLAIL